MYLVYVLAQSITPAIMALGTAAGEQQRTLNNVVLALGAMQSEHSQQKSLGESTLRVLQATCANAAPSNEARERCFR